MSFFLWMLYLLTKMLKVVFILFEVFFIFVNGACPDNCDCNGHKMVCSAIPLDNPPEEITAVTITGLNETGSLVGLEVLSSIKLLNLSRLDIVRLDDISNINLPMVETLILSHNRLKRLNDNDFIWCPNVKRLDLSNNFIKVISEATFDSLTSLTSLNLSNNDLEDFEVVSYISPSIEELDMTNNILKYITIFNELPRLRRLLLCGNKYMKWPTNVCNSIENLEELCLGSDLSEGIEAAGDLANLQHLRSLTLNLKSTVHLTVLTELSKMSKLTYLSIDSCHLDNLSFLSGLNALNHLKLTKVSLTDINCPSDALKNVSVLNLSGSPEIAAAIITSTTTLMNTSLTTFIAPSCNITTIPRQIVAQIEIVDISFNPLNCDRTFIEALVSRNMTFLNAENTICALPADFSGWTLTDVIINYPNDNAIPYSSGLDKFLEAIGVSREHLFYLCVALVSLLLICGVLVMIFIKCKFCKLTRFGSSVKKTGWKGRFSKNYDKENGCTEDFFFPRVDNEYTFDNFMIADTMTRKNEQTED
ncbi:hypothetical protein CHUAL_002207 [Chamberlinius hualienensis]